jgi:S1-C subfamily serine protease
VFEEVVNMSQKLIELSNALAEVTEHAAASTVAVHTETRGSSSGVVWRAGVVVTAEHALHHDEEIHLTLPDGRVVPAALAGRDPSTDIAVLKCEQASRAVSSFGDVGSLKPGNLVLVVGRTRASGSVAALAMVSLAAAERRTRSGASLAPYVRLDTGLQPTAAGGAVIDAHGDVVGMASPRFARFGAMVIPAPMVNHVVDTLLQKGRIPRGYLGVGLQPIRLPDTLRQSLQRDEKTAAIVLEVEPDGPASKAGIVIGDILVSLAGRAVTRLEDVYSQLPGEAIAKPLILKFMRGGAMQETSIVVGERPHGGIK